MEPILKHLQYFLICEVLVRAVKRSLLASQVRGYLSRGVKYRGELCGCLGKSISSSGPEAEECWRVPGTGGRLPWLEQCTAGEMGRGHS